MYMCMYVCIYVLYCIVFVFVLYCIVLYCIVLYYVENIEKYRKRAKIVKRGKMKNVAMLKILAIRSLGTLG